jgi:hypothetical protein
MDLTGLIVGIVLVVLVAAGIFLTNKRDVKPK